jgi:hypothetical protein
MLPCIVIDFLLNNQPDVLIIQIYSVIKVYMFRASSLPTIEFFTVHSALVRFTKVSDDRFQAESRLCLEAVIRNLHEPYQCRMHSRKLLMVGRENARNVEFYNRINLDN